MKLESLVIADQDAAVNTSLGLAHTARHVLGVYLARRFWNKPLSFGFYIDKILFIPTRVRKFLFKDI